MESSGKLRICSHHPVKSLGLNVIAPQILGDEVLNTQPLSQNSSEPTIEGVSLAIFAILNSRVRGAHDGIKPGA